MNEFIITTENSCDLSDERLGKAGIKVIHLHYFINGEEILADDFDIKAFYACLRAGDKGSTSQANPFEYEEAWKPILLEGKDILHVGFSSVLSGSYKNACSAAKTLQKEFPERKIFVFDSKSQAAGQGLLVTLIARYKEEGHTFEECCAFAEEWALKVNHVFTIDDLRSLTATGRVSDAEAFIGNLLQIKPLLYTNEKGELTPYAKVMGRKIALNFLCDKVKAKFSGEEKTIFIAHGDCEKDAEYVGRRLESLGVNVEYHYISPVIGCHTGANVLAIFFVGKDRNIKG